MTREAVEAWVRAYERAWRSPGTAALAELFTENASYLLSPYGQPAAGLVDGDRAVVRAEDRAAAAVAPGSSG